MNSGLIHHPSSSLALLDTPEGQGSSAAGHSCIASLMGSRPAGQHIPYRRKRQLLLSLTLLEPGRVTKLSKEGEGDCVDPCWASGSCPAT
ncbi:hypothetical protein E2C01_084605 [Portunus trituberculatus]|uniref:Uncharacterized protein n=1 Tax=Portunus trituberculatus TaxID=210409 RepID=A0A5B7IVT5_PORTR|nr:hypothetical protein [Portunus trituberculatus]